MKLSIRVNAADRTRVLSVNTNVGGLPPNDEADGGSRPQPRLPFSPLLLQNTPSPLPTPALLSTQRGGQLIPPEHLTGVLNSVICFIEQETDVCRILGLSGLKMFSAGWPPLQKLDLRRRREEEEGAKEVARCQTSCLPSPRPLPVQPLHLSFPHCLSYPSAPPMKMPPE